MARQAIHDHRVTVRLACQAFKISETCYRYDPKLSSENELIADWLLRLTTTHKQWGFGLCFMYLRNTKGNVIDDYNRECLGIEVDHSLPAQRVIKSLEQLIEWRGKPKAIRCDNEPEYISHALRE